MKRPTLLTLTLVCLPGAGCDASGRPREAQLSKTEFEYHIDTLPNGAARIVNRTAGSDAIVATWTATEDWSVAVGAGVEERLRSVRYIDVHPQTRDLYVLDPESSDIKIYEDSGTFSHSIATAPQGHPAGGMSFLWDVDGNIVVRDQAGYSILRPDGSIEGHWSAIFAPNTPPYRAVFDSNGGLIETNGQLGAIDGERRAWPTLVFRVSEDFTRTDSLPPIDFTVDLVPDTPIPVPMNNRIVHYIDRESTIWFAEASDYRIFRRTLRGDTTLVFSLDAEPASIPAENKEVIAADWSQVYSASPEDVPDMEPIIYRITQDDHGRVFVFPRLEGIISGTVADVFHDGIFQGRISLPVALDLLWHLPVVSGDRMYGVTTDRTSGRRVVALRIQNWQ